MMHPLSHCSWYSSCNQVMYSFVVLYIAVETDSSVMCALGCCLTAYTAKTMLLVQLLQCIFGKSTAHSQNALSTDCLIKLISACSWYDHIWYNSFPAGMTYNAWYCCCHTVQRTDHVIMYNIVDAIVLMAQLMQYQFDTAAYGTPIGEIMYTWSSSCHTCFVTACKHLPYRSICVLPIILKQISKVEEKPFTSSLNIF